MPVIDEKEAFANRLNQALNDSGYPVKGENRQAIVGKIFGVTQKAARKWLEGEGMPTLERCIIISKQLDVNFEWLMTGRSENDPEDDSINEERSPHHVANFQHKVIFELFDGLTKRQQVEAIKQLENIVKTNKQILKELKGREGFGDGD